MGNGLYDFGRQLVLTGGIDIDTDPLRLMLIDETDDTPNLTADQYIQDRAVASRVKVASSALSSVAVSAGVVDAADYTFTAVTGDGADSIDCFKYVDDGGNPDEDASPLLFNIDTATGLPVTPNGGDITVQWDSGTNKIFNWANPA